MSHNAKILLFPSQPADGWLSARDAEIAAREYLATPLSERSESDRRRCLCNPDILLAICALLRQQRDLVPAAVESAARDAYQWISRPNCNLGLFDERDYFLGETALLAGAACRQLGRREEASLWLDRAEAGFRHTMNPAPGLSNVAYARLALRFEMGRYQDVLELAPSLEASFKKLRMNVEAAKCRLLMATTLKITGEHAGAIAMLANLPSEPFLEGEPFLRARVFAELGDLHQLVGQFGVAASDFKLALSLLQGREVSSTRADVKLFLGAAYKSLGSFEKAIEAFRAGQRDYDALEMRAFVAYAHLLVAETLLEMKREREAEWEILAALPAIDELKMVPEGFAAVALLRESVARRKPDLSALQQLRAQIQAS